MNIGSNTIVKYLMFKLHFPGIIFQTRLPVYISHAPAGTSMQDMVHFAQVNDNGIFIT